MCSLTYYSFNAISTKLLIGLNCRSFFISTFYLEKVFDNKQEIANFENNSLGSSDSGCKFIKSKAKRNYTYRLCYARSNVLGKVIGWKGEKRSV